MRFACLMAFSLLVAGTAMAQNIVVNPGFETGTFAPWVASPYGGLGGQPWLDGSSFFGSVPYSGSKFASNGCNQPACIGPDSGVGAWFYQDLATVNGATYTLSFYFSPGSGGAGAELQVLWGPTSVPLTIGPSGTCGGNCVYRTTAIGTKSYSLVTVSNLVANSTSMRLEFIAEQDPDVSGIDDVSVVSVASYSVPALSTGGLFALAAALVATGLLLIRIARPV